MARRNKYFGNTSAVVPVDPSKQTEEGAALRERVKTATRSSGPTRLDSMLARVKTLYRPSRSQVMAYAEARTVVDAIYAAELARRGRSLLLDADTDLVIEKLTRYFIGDPGDPTRLAPSQYKEDLGQLVPVDWIPLHKSVFIYGKVGVGKTFLHDMMRIFTRVAELGPMAFQKVRANQIMLAVHNAKSMSPINNLKAGNLLIDDLGKEKTSQRVYAEDEDPIDHIIDFRYESYIANGLLTHFTSNKMPDELEKRYGTRNWDRLNEMCEFIWFPGLSKRPDLLSTPENEDDELHDADFPAP